MDSARDGDPVLPRIIRLADGGMYDVLGGPRGAPPAGKEPQRAHQWIVKLSNVRKLFEIKGNSMILADCILLVWCGTFIHAVNQYTGKCCTAYDMVSPPLPL